MKLAIALAGTILGGGIPDADAQETPAPPSGESAQSDPAATGEAQQGVLVFTPDFFASSAPDTAFDMIRRLPGFALDIGNIDARGLAGTAGNVLIDGDRPSSKSDGLDQVLRRISAASVERIELIRGGAPGIDMQGRSVIANVVLKRAATTEIVLEANAYFYPDGYVGPLLKGSWSRREGDNQTEFAFSATTDRTEGTASGHRTRYDAAGNVIQEADLDLWDRYRNANGRGAIQRVVGGGKLRVNGLLDYTNFNHSQTIDVISGVGVDNFNSDVDHEWNAELGANWQRPLGPRTELELTALWRPSWESYASESGDALGDASTFSSDSSAGESIGRAILKFRSSEKWAFEGGGEVAYNFLDSATAYAENGVTVPLPNASVRVSELRGEGFGQMTWRPETNLTVEAGMRVELSRISQTGDTDLSKSFVYPKPRVQLTWLPGTGHQIRVRAEKQVSQLDFGDFVASTEINFGTVAGGNADLEPQKVTILEGVYEYRFWNKGVFELTASHNILTDVIDVIPLVGGFEAVGNIGDGVSDFVQARVTLPLDRLGLKDALLSGRAAWTWSHVTDPLTQEERRLSGQLPFACAISFSHDISGGKFSWGFDHGCNADDYTNYRVREVRELHAQPFVTLYGQWKPRTDLTVRVDVGNATDFRQTNTRYVYSGPRNTSPLLFRERREAQRGEYLFLQIRKTV